MPSAEFSSEKHLLIRADQNSDLIQFLEALAEQKHIDAATFTAIGALKYAELGFFDQQKQEYQKVVLDSPHEIAGCIGNISLKNEKPFVHAHATLGDKFGNTKSGHLIKGIVFAAEIYLCKLSGQRLERKYDEDTNLSLWEVE
jgi:predicted DNA-binding protein with PD1-like motif